MKKIQYGLREIKTGKMVTYSVSSNGDAEDCGSTTTRLTIDDDASLWLVPIPEQAEYVRNYSTDWFNSSHDTPEHSFKAKDFEVVKVKTEIYLNPVKVSIPTTKELFTEFAKSDPGHQFTLKRLSGGEKFHYMWWDLSRYLNEKKKNKK